MRIVLLNAAVVETLRSAMVADPAACAVRSGSGTPVPAVKHVRIMMLVVVMVLFVHVIACVPPAAVVSDVVVMDPHDPFVVGVSVAADVVLGRIIDIPVLSVNVLALSDMMSVATL